MFQKFFKFIYLVIETGHVFFSVCVFLYQRLKRLRGLACTCGSGIGSVMVMICVNSVCNSFALMYVCFKCDMSIYSTFMFEDRPIQGHFKEYENSETVN